MSTTHWRSPSALLAASVLLSSTTVFADNEQLEPVTGGFRMKAGLRYGHDLDAIGGSLPPVVADFTGDMRPDLFGVLGTQPFVSISIGSMNLESDLDLPSSSSSVSALCRADFAGMDVPAMIGSLNNSLAAWSFDPTTGAISRTVPIGASNWADAIELHCTDLDDDGVLDLIGSFQAGTSGTTLQVGKWTGDPTVPGAFSISVTATLPLAAPLTALEVVDLHGSTPGKEVVFVYDDRVGVLDKSLSFVDFRFLSEDAVCAAPIEDTEGTGLAIVTRSPASWDSVVVVRPTLIEPPTSVGPLQIQSMAVADHLAGGQADLALLGSELVVLKNDAQPAAETYAISVDHPQFVTQATINDGGREWIVADDFDNDGDGDLAWLWVGAPGEVDNRLLVTRNSLIHEGDESMLLEQLEVEFTGPSDPLNATAKVLVGSASDVANSGYTHVQTVLITNTQTSAVPAFSSLTAIGPVPPSTLGALIPFSDTVGQTGLRRMVFLRPVEVDAVSGDVIRAGPDLRLDTYFSYTPGVGWDSNSPSTDIGVIPGNELPPPPGMPDPAGDGNGPPPPGTRTNGG